MNNLDDKLIIKVVEYNTDKDAEIILSLLPSYKEGDVIFITLNDRVLEVFKGDMIVQTLDNYIGIYTKQGKKHILN